MTLARAGIAAPLGDQREVVERDRDILTVADLARESLGLTVVGFGGIVLA